MIHPANENREAIAMFAPPFSCIVCQRNQAAIFKAQTTTTAKNL